MQHPKMLYLVLCGAHARKKNTVSVHEPPPTMRSASTFVNYLKGYFAYNTIIIWKLLDE